MKRFKFLLAAAVVSLAFACNAPETASDVNESEEVIDKEDRGMNTTEDDNTDVQTMEEKYKDADEDVILDSL